MSSITGLISGGGGGSQTNIVTDPRKLPKIASTNFYVKRQPAVVEPSFATNFYTYWLPWSDRAAAVAVTANDTYATLLDIPSSNGGYLHWVLSNGIGSTYKIATVKITVDDGDPVELSYNWDNITGTPTSNTARMVIGGGWTPALASTNTGYYYATSAVENTYYNVAFVEGGQPGSAWAYDDPINNVYGGGKESLYYNAPSSMVDSLNYAKLAFDSSLKIEVKQSVINSSDASNYAACYFTLH